MAKIAIPTSPEELEELLNDNDRMKAVWKDGQFAELTKSYMTAMMDKNNGELTAQLKESLQTGLTQFVRENGQNFTPKLDLSATSNGGLKPGLVHDKGSRVSRGRGAVYNKAAYGAKLEAKTKEGEGFTSIGEYCAAIRAQHDGVHRNYADLMKKLDVVRDIQNSFGSEVPADGGFIIPEVMRTDLLQLALEDSIVRSRATVIPMSSLRVPIPAVDETSHVSSLFGGITFYWAEESSSIPESQAAFQKIWLEASKLAGYFKAPNELLADAVAFSSWFDSRVPAGLAWFEDLYFMTGTGVGQPVGFINCPASVQVAAEAGQPTQTVVVENLAKMYSRMLPQSLGSAVWIVAPDVVQQLLTMALSVGTGGAPVFLVNNGIQDTPNLSIYGRPVLVTEKVPGLGTTGDISFVDLGYYLVGDRQMIQIASSEHAAFQNDQTAFRLTERVDGKPWIQSPLTPHNNSTNTLTPFVQLATR